MAIPKPTIKDVMRVMKSYIETSGSSQQCLQTSMIFAELLKAAGYTDAHLLTVSVTALNAVAVELLSKYNGKLDDPQLVAEGVLRGACVQLITFEGPIDENQWAGHLVVIIPNHFGTHHAMCDLTIKQLDTPEGGIVLRPLWCIKVDDEFLSGKSNHYENVDQSMLIYKSHPCDTTYQDNDGSKKKQGFRVLIARAKLHLKNGTSFE